MQVYLVNLIGAKLCYLMGVIISGMPYTNRYHAHFKLFSLLAKQLDAKIQNTKKINTEKYPFESKKSLII